MKVIDTRGQKCPAPLIATRKALREDPEGEAVKILTDSRNALNNISKFLDDNHPGYRIEEYPEGWGIVIESW